MSKAPFVMRPNQPTKPQAQEKEQHRSYTDEKAAADEEIRRGIQAV
jgi:hypothetical protein